MWKLLSPVWWLICNPLDCTVHGILQARILEWVAFPFSRGSSQPGILPRSPTLQVNSLPPEPQGSPRILEWVTYPFSRRSSWPRNQTGVSCIAGVFFTELSGKPHTSQSSSQINANEMRYIFQSVRLANNWKPDNTHCWKKCEEEELHVPCYFLVIQGLGIRVFQRKKYKPPGIPPTFSISIYAEWLLQWPVHFFPSCYQKGKRSFPVTPVDLFPALWIPSLTNILFVRYITNRTHGHISIILATHSSTLAWEIPWMEEPGRLQSTGSWRVGHDWVISLSLFTFMHWRRQWQPTPVFLPGEFQGRGSLVGCRLWGRTESDTTEET